MRVYRNVLTHSLFVYISISLSFLYLSPLSLSPPLSHPSHTPSIYLSTALQSFSPSIYLYYIIICLSPSPIRRGRALITVRMAGPQMKFLGNARRARDSIKWKQRVANKITNDFSESLGIHVSMLYTIE